MSSEDSKVLRFMSTSAVMRRTGLSQASVERLSRSGRDGFPKAIKVGRINYFDVAGVERFVKRAQENKGIKRRRAENAADYVEVLA
jgi:predicted DNA-binding transcriptional regulator AlpA